MLREERMKRRYTKDMETRESDIQKLSPSYSSDECCSWNISGFPRCDHTKNVTFWSRILDSKSETKGRHFTFRLKHLFNCQHSNLSSIFLPALEQQCPKASVPEILRRSEPLAHLPWWVSEHEWERNLCCSTSLMFPRWLLPPHIITAQNNWRVTSAKQHKWPNRTNWRACGQVYIQTQYE